MTAFTSNNLKLTAIQHFSAFDRYDTFSNMTIQLPLSPFAITMFLFDFIAFNAVNSSSDKLLNFFFLQARFNCSAALCICRHIVRKTAVELVAAPRVG